MTFMEAVAQAKAGNRAFYRMSWRTGRREKTARIGLLLGWYVRSWVADRRNLAIMANSTTGF